MVRFRAAGNTARHHTMDTVVVKLPAGAQDQLEQRLRSGDFTFRSVDHARFGAKGEGVNAVLYRSGKLVVQGKETTLFVARYLDGLAEVPGAAAKSSGNSAGPVGAEEGGHADDVARVGSDEAGKGDYFGPLVVCALRLGPGDAVKLRQGGVMDSKKLTDERVFQLAPALMERFPHRVEVLDPPLYNATHAKVKNLNPMLADLHAAAIRAVAEPGIDVLVDKFGNEKLVADRLKGVDIRLRQETKAERIPAVAAASVVARYEFVRRLAALSEEYGVDLRKGAGAPTDKSARAFLRLHGEAKLGEVAKLHFKNTSKVLR